eukprot:s418_g8.t1
MEIDVEVEEDPPHSSDRTRSPRHCQAGKDGTYGCLSGQSRGLKATLKRQAHQEDREEALDAPDPFDLPDDVWLELGKLHF